MAIDLRTLRTGVPEARWVLALLLGAFAAALGLLAVSQLAAFFVWGAGSAGTVVFGAWHARLFERTPRRTASLPSAMTVSWRERARRSVPPRGSGSAEQHRRGDQSS